jgi:hypothetical protein
MRIVKIIALAAFLIGSSGMMTLSAQIQLDRISITERADGMGYVVRFHLSEMVTEYEHAQPETDIAQMVLRSAGLEPVEMIPITETDLITDFKLTRMTDAIGVQIQFAEGVYFKTDVYPDINGRDLLLSLEYTSYTVTESIAQISEPIFPADNDIDEPEDEITARPAEEPVQIEEIVPDAHQQKPVRLSMGFMTGVSLAVVSSNTFSKGFRNGIAIGASFDIQLPYLLLYDIQPAIETGVYYAQKGFTNPSPNFLNAETVEFDYIEIPVLGKFSYPFMDIVSPHLLIGPYTGFMANAERVRGDGTRSDLDDHTNTVVFGAILGAGLDVEFAGTVLSGQIRGSIDFSNAFNSSLYEGDEIGHFKHRYLSVLIGVRF